MEAKTFIVSTYSIVDIHGAWIPRLYLSSSLLSSPPVFPHPLCSTQWLWGSPLSCFHSSGNHHPSRGSHYPTKGGCYSVWRTVSQSNCVYGLCKDSIFFPVGQQCVQVSLLPHFLSSQSSPFPSPGLESLSKPYRTLPENDEKNNYGGIRGGITRVKEEREGRTEWTDGKEIQRGEKRNEWVEEIR